MPAELFIDGVNVSARAHYEVSIDVGRDSVDTQPEATVLSARLEGWKPAGQVHAEVRLEDQYGQLFAGRTTDLAAALNPERGVWETSLTAVSALGDLGRVNVGDVPWPEETDSQRVVRILQLAGADTSGIDPDVPGPLVLPRDVDRQPALKLCQDVALSCMGVFWEHPGARSAALRYTPQSQRSWSSFVIPWKALPDDVSWGDLPPEVTWETFGSGVWKQEQASLDLSAEHVLAEVSVDQQISTLARRVRVIYGPALQDEAGQEIPRPVAVSGDEPPELEQDTQLAQEIDAARQADTLWRSRREPAWLMRSITLLPLENLPYGIAAEIRRSLAIGTRVTLKDIGFDSPVGTSWQGYLEGWSHTLSEGRHTVRMYLSGRALTEPADRWKDLNPTMSWADIPPNATWDQAAWV